MVIENTTRHLEMGKTRLEATIAGVREIGFTIVSMTVSLIAVFIPVLLMGGIIGRLFREFAVCVSVAVAVSGIISLTMTPMLCAWLLGDQPAETHGRTLPAVAARVRRHAAGAMPTGSMSCCVIRG